ncbi:uncharacterized protein LOC131242916 [Magnolia sinica]|uniref:uncharacterized protein LOC131242916 n=1 Tax=Magnolia sinica TaxID=86752 RepID=UPI00265A392C|nr:uncharacterized protein LOC131242916 [Magnolia sinica]
MALESWFVEQAREELQILESQHPNRFDYLKLELKTFISESDKFSSSSRFLSENLHSLGDDSHSTSASTQVSSNRRKRKDSKFQECGVDFQKSKPKIRRCGVVSEDRVDMVIQRAEACLQKIKETKENFLNGGDVL